MNTRHIVGFVAALSLNAAVALAFAAVKPEQDASLAAAEASVSGSLPEIVVEATRLPSGRTPRS
jgi:hypothetical protein